MSVRRAIHSAISNDLAVSAVLGGRLFAAGGVPNGPTRPFAVLRWGDLEPGIARMERRRLTVFVHDDRGDYLRIDDIGGDIRNVLEFLPHTRFEGGSVSKVEFEGASVDLEDPTYDTGMRTWAYRIVGVGV